MLIETNYNVREREFLIDGFKNGFPIGYEGPRVGIQHRAPNLKLRVGSQTILWNKIMKEVKNKRYAGPFSKPPYKDFIQSPVGLVPKDKDDTRLIFHLSYPRTGVSINSATPKNLCLVKYCDFDEAVRACMANGVSCFIGKSDYKSAFRNLGIRNLDWPVLLIMTKSPIDHKVYFFVEKCLPFGASISCSHFQRFSDVVAHILKSRVPDWWKINYLDDYLFVSFLRESCNEQIRIFLNICKEINFPVSMEKTYSVTNVLIFLGFLLNTISQMVSIPVDKVERVLNILRTMLKKRKTTVKELEKLCGHLNFLCRCIVPGHTFTRRIYTYFSSSMKPFHHVNINREIRGDLEMWLEFLQNPTTYCRPFLDYTVVLATQELNWMTDASGKIGFGGVCGSNWIQGRWSNQFLQKKPSIEYLELFAVVVSVAVWSSKFRNKRIYLFCNNQAVVHMINETSSNCRNCMVLIRK